MRTFQLVSITVHVLAAAAWFGSMVFLAGVLVPGLRGREAADRAELIATTGRRLRALVWPLYAVLALTGATQLWLRGYRWADLAGPLWQGSAGHVLVVKLALFALTLLMAALHDFVLGPRALVDAVGTATALRRRRFARVMGRSILLLAVLLIACGIAYARGGLRP